MRNVSTPAKWLALLSVCFAGALATAGSLEIKFKPLQDYRDLGADARERESIQKELQAYFEQMAAKRLPEAQVLRIDLTEIDRAGEVEPRFRAGMDIRVMREVTWPRMEFSYSVLEGERVLQQGKANLADMNYLGSTSLRYSDGDALRYEKSMLDKWFDEVLPLPKSRQP